MTGRLIRLAAATISPPPRRDWAQLEAEFNDRQMRGEPCLDLVPEMLAALQLVEMEPQQSRKEVA